MNLFSRIFRFYYDGFRNMKSWGKALWIIIIVKLFFMFVVMKLFFFPNKLNSEFSTDEERSRYVIEQLTNENR